MISLDGLWWLLLSLGPLFLLQRTLHKELQGFLLILTRRLDASFVIFSLLFFPGVFLHELSHFLMARLLGVRTGKFSLIPQNLGNGQLRLGYVETAKVDFIRDALIGFAPLISGMLFVGFSGEAKLGLLTLWNTLTTSNQALILETLHDIIARPNYWVWFYITVAVSSTMMPSESDRRAWMPLLLAVGSLLLTGIIFGLGPVLVDSVLLPINEGLKTMALIFITSAFVQLVVLVPVFFSRKILSRITGLEIVQV